MAKKAAPKPLWKKVLTGTGYVLFCAFALGIGTIAGWIAKSPVLSAGLKQTITNRPPREVFGKDAFTMLVLGCDENRAPGGAKVTTAAARSDMMLAVRVDLINGEVTGISIPRDTLWRVPGYSEQKINAYHSIGGKELAKRAVEGLLGVPIDRVAVINYESFQHMVDMVGGIELDVEKRMKKTDRRGDLYIDLQPGLQRLNGYDAMCYVRYRGDSDFHRQERQRAFVLKFKEAVLSRPQMINEIATESVNLLGGELSPDEMAALARFAQSVQNEDIRMGMVPVNEAANYNLRVDEDKLPDVLAEFHFVPQHYTSRLVRS